MHETLSYVASMRKLLLEQILISPSFAISRLGLVATIKVQSVPFFHCDFAIIYSQVCVLLVSM